MRDKQNILVMAGLAGLVLMFAGAGYLLFRGISRYSSAERKADGMFRKLSTHYGANPFPSELNVEIKQTNASHLAAWSEALLTELRKGNVSTVERTPSRFMALVGRTRNRLLRMAEAHEVSVGSDFAFGFDRYLAEEGSALPPPRVVPELTQQLVFIDEIAQIVMTNRVAALRTVEREDPEGGNATRRRGSAPTSRRRSRRTAATGTAAPSQPRPTAGNGDDLYETFSFAFEFDATERVLLSVLNELAAHRGFVTVTHVEFHRGDAPDVAPVPDVEPTIVRVPPSPEMPEGDTRKVWPPHQERVIAGPSREKPMRTRIEIEVFRFKEEAGSGTA